MSTAGDKYKNLKVKELQELLQKNGIPHTGKKEELIDRLVKHDEQTAQELANLEEEFGDLSEFDDTKLALDDEAKLVGLDDIADPIKPIEAEEKKEATVVEEEKPKETTTTTAPVEPVVKPNSNFKFTPVTFDKKPESPKPAAAPAAKVVEEKKKEPVSPAVKSPSSTTTTKANDDAEKALERAKRFGIQLNETSKKDIRAQRFGLPANDQKAPSPASPKAAAAKGGIAPEVLKKRAERFGLPENKTAAATKPAAVVKGDKVPVSLDPAEEEKKRKRAERFNSDASKKQKNE